MPANPISVKSTLPSERFADDPCTVWSSPKAIQGWRPSSVVNHPAVFAMNGNGSASSRIQSIPRVWKSRRRQSKSAARAIMAMKKVPNRRQFSRLIRGDLLPFQVSTWFELDDAGNEPHDDSQGDKQPAVVEVLFHQQVVGTQAGHGEGAGKHSPAHGMQVLRDNPGIEQHRPVIG